MGTIDSILDVSKRSLNAQAQVIRTISDNISNVNTPGYSRRTAELVTTQSAGTANLRTGTGVEVNRITRTVDQFLNKEYLARISDTGAASARQEFLSRAEQPFTLDDTPGHIGYEMSGFFAALSDLATSPSDIPLRTQVIVRGQSLTAAIRDTYNHIAGLQREADQRVSDTVDQVNTITTQVADLNSQIANSELSGQENLTLRDNRDQKLRDLAKLVPISTVEQAHGQLLVSLSNGYALVNGSDHNDLVFTQTPDFTTFPHALDGGALGSVVADFAPNNPAAGQVDFTALLAGQGGELGGLLRTRGYFNQANNPVDTFDATGDLVDMASRVEVITRDLLSRFNMVYRGDTDFNNAASPASILPPTGPTPHGGDENSGTNIFDPSSVDLNGNTPSLYGLFNVSTNPSPLVDTNANGLEDDVSIVGGDNYSSRLIFNVSDERKLAIAQDQDLTVGTAGTLAWAPGDATIANSLANLRTQTVNYGQFGIGTFSATTNIEDLYRETVGFVGSVGSKAQSDLNAYTDRENQVKDLHDSLSGVSLDEEFANLINYQRAFEAAGKMVRVGDELFSDILNLLG